MREKVKGRGWRAPKKKKGSAIPMSKRDEHVTIIFKNGRQRTYRNVLATFVVETRMLKLCLAEDEEADEWTEISWFNLDNIKEIKQWTEPRLALVLDQTSS